MRENFKGQKRSKFLKSKVFSGRAENHFGQTNGKPKVEGRGPEKRAPALLQGPTQQKGQRGDGVLFSFFFF